MLATSTILHGWDYLFAAGILLVAVVLERVEPRIPAVAWATLFLVALFGLALCVRFGS